MKFLLSFTLFFNLFGLHAEAGILSPLAELSCKAGDRVVELTLNDERSNTVTVKSKTGTVIGCTVAVGEIRSFSRGPQKVKTLYLDTKICTGNADKSKFSPVLPSGMVVFSGMNSLSLAELHILENSQALKCKVKSMQQKKLEKFALPKAP